MTKTLLKGIQFLKGDTDRAIAIVWKPVTINHSISVSTWDRRICSYPARNRNWKVAFSERPALFSSSEAKKFSIGGMYTAKLYPKQREESKTCSGAKEPGKGHGGGHGGGGARALPTPPQHFVKDEKCPFYSKECIHIIFEGAISVSKSAPESLCPPSPTYTCFVRHWTCWMTICIIVICTIRI